MDELEAIDILRKIRMPFMKANEDSYRAGKGEDHINSLKVEACNRAISALSDEKTCRKCGRKDYTVVNDLCIECYKKTIYTPTKMDTVTEYIEPFAYVTVPLALITIAVKLLLT